MEEKSKKSTSDLSAFIESKEEINGTNVILAICEGYEISILKQIVDSISNQVENSFVLLANVNGNNVNFIAKSTSDKINAGSIVKEISGKCKGNGGGSPKFAQGGGSDATNIADYLSEIKENIKML